MRKGVSAIRSLRVNKSRKRIKPLLLIGKIAIVWFLLIFSIVNLPVKSTNAFFTSQTKNSSALKSKPFTKHGSLGFTGEAGGDCNEIYAFLVSNGNGAMSIDSKYYVYYDPASDPVTQGGITGELVFKNGIIPKMPPGDAQLRLYYKPLKTGNYKFVAFVPSNKTDRSGKNVMIEGMPVTLSDTISVKCTE